MKGKAEDRSDDPDEYVRINMEKRPLKHVVYWCIAIALPLAIFAVYFSAPISRLH